MAVGVGLFALWNRHYSLASTATFQVIAGIGMGIHFTAPSLAMQASVDTNDQGLSVGILVSFRLFGALIGLAVGATTFSSVFAKSIASVGPLPEAAAILHNAGSAVGFIPYLRTTDLPVEVMDGIRGAYNDAIQAIWYVLAAFSGLGFLSSLLVEELTLETEEVGRQHFEQ